MSSFCLSKKDKERRVNELAEILSNETTRRVFDESFLKTKILIEEQEYINNFCDKHLGMGLEYRDIYQIAVLSLFESLNRFICRDSEVCWDFNRYFKDNLHIDFLCAVVGVFNFYGMSLETADMLSNGRIYSKKIKKAIEQLESLPSQPKDILR